MAATLDHTHVREGIARPIGKLYEAESLVGIVPFDHGLDRGPEIPLSDRSKAVLEVMARGQRRFVHDSLLEERVSRRTRL